MLCWGAGPCTVWHVLLLGAVPVAATLTECCPGSSSPSDIDRLYQAVTMPELPWYYMCIDQVLSPEVEPGLFHILFQALQVDAWPRGVCTDVFFIFGVCKPLQAASLQQHRQKPNLCNAKLSDAKNKILRPKLRGFQHETKHLSSGLFHTPIRSPDALSRTLPSLPAHHDDAISSQKASAVASGSNTSSS